MTLVYIGLGSNLSEPIKQVQRALHHLSQLPKSNLIVVSSLYRTKPLEPKDQPDFINAVCALETRLAPLELLGRLQQLEAQQGRVRGPERWGPRIIDLDILLYGEESIKEPELQVPHPSLRERSFVIVPLSEIAPDLILPTGESMLTLRNVCEIKSVERLRGLSCRE